VIPAPPNGPPRRADAAGQTRPPLGRSLRQLAATFLLIALAAGCASSEPDGGRRATIDPALGQAATSVAAAEATLAAATRGAEAGPAATAAAADGVAQGGSGASSDPGTGCIATASEVLPQHYEAGAPERPSIGKGFTLTGVILAEGTCLPVSDALVEVWLAGPDGSFGTDWRASLRSDEAGAFAIDTHPPVAAEGGLAAVYMRVSAAGLDPVVTTHWPAAGVPASTLAIVLPAD
jgi:hypothetical protein